MPVHEVGDDHEGQPNQDVHDVRLGEAPDHRPQGGADRDPERPIDACGDEDRGRKLGEGHPRGPGDERHDHTCSGDESADDDRYEATTMDPFGPAIDLGGIDVDPCREPVCNGRSEAPREEVRHERPGGRRESAHEHDLRELRQVAARAVAVEGDDDVGRCGERNAGLLDRDHEEENDVLVLEYREKKQTDRVADHRRQAHARQSLARRTIFDQSNALRGRQSMPAKRRSTTSARRASASPRETPNFFDRLEWRNAGPYRGGRVAAVAGDPRERNTFYFGSTGGGVWKTMDGGQYWENTTDKFFKRASVGAIGVAQADANVIYVGMGESCIRGNVSHGDGVYRSTDAGQTWTHLGLADTRNIGKIRVHPEDPDTAYVAALGHAHGPNTERGVFRTRDGGKTWKKVLYRSENAGAVDISLDPNNPRIIYASFWEAIRRPWELVSGGPGSGIFRSNDGGDTWIEISRNKGLPKGLLGKIGISASAAKSGRVYAIVEAEDGGIYRSDNFGETWERGSEDRNLRQRAWYYHHIYAHPTDPETVWVLNVSAWLSNDGGKTFQEQSIPHGDHHDLWIDPKNPDRIINGNDGGAGITAADSFAIGGGESGYIAVRSDDPNVVFAGNYQGILTRYDRRTGQARNIMVWPESSAGEGAKDVKYRVQWTAPTVHSPHDPNVLYHTGNHVFRTTDEGATWERISPDLTRNDKSKLGPSGGPITKDNTGAEYYCTIFAFAESPVGRGVLWAGSDDGLLHVSRDDGKTWKNVTPAAIKPFSLVSIIEPSPHDAGTAYVATTRYKHDDFKPYLWKTTNYGRTWTKITNGIPADDFTRVIREDPTRKGLLYAGTETGVYVSFDDGARWNRLGGNLPVVPIHDMVVKDSDLVLGTHGRSFWVLDDLSPIRQLAAEATKGKTRLFTPRPTVRL